MLAEQQLLTQGGRMAGSLLILAALFGTGSPATDLRFRHPVVGGGPRGLSHPVTELAANLPQVVTEHFNRVQPGLIARIPESVFQGLQDEEDFEDIRRESEANRTTTSKPVPVDKTTVTSRVEEKTTSKQLAMDKRPEDIDDISENGGQVEDGKEDEANSFHSLFHAFDAGMVKYHDNTTNNPLDNLKDFSTWEPPQDQDFYLNLENDVEDNEFSLYDQIAVESGAETQITVPRGSEPHLAERKSESGASEDGNFGDTDLFHPEDQSTGMPDMLPLLVQHGLHPAHEAVNETRLRTASQPADSALQSADPPTQSAEPAVRSAGPSAQSADPAAQSADSDEKSADPGAQSTSAPAVESSSSSSEALLDKAAQPPDQISRQEDILLPEGPEAAAAEISSTAQPNLDSPKVMPIKEVTHPVGEMVHHDHPSHHPAQIKDEPKEEGSFPQLLYHEAQKAAEPHEASPAEAALNTALRENNDQPTAEVRGNKDSPDAEVRVDTDLMKEVDKDLPEVKRDKEKDIPDAEVVVNADLMASNSEHVYEETGGDYVESAAYDYHNQEEYVDLDEAEGRAPLPREEEVAVHHFDPKLNAFVLEQKQQQRHEPVDSDEFDYVEEADGSPVLPHPAHRQSPEDRPAQQQLAPEVRPLQHQPEARLVQQQLDRDQHLTSLPEDLYQVVTSNSLTPVEEEEEPVKEYNEYTSSSSAASADDEAPLQFHDYEYKPSVINESSWSQEAEEEERQFEMNPEQEKNSQHNLIDVEYPLITLMDIQPHSIKLLVKPKEFHPQTMVRLLYERVPRNKPPLMRHLNDPVIEYIPLYKAAQEHGISDLPMGKYIVCAEAQVHGQILQTNCFETLIERLDNNMLQSGVIAVIAVAIIIVVAVILYAIYYRIMSTRRKRKERELAEKVEKVARKEKELNEKMSTEILITAGYPDPNEPYEERCIM